jgi:hypothetical protein
MKTKIIIGIIISILLLGSLTIAGLTANLPSPKSNLDITIEKNAVTDKYKSIEHRVVCDGVDCKITIYATDRCYIQKITNQTICKELKHRNEILDKNVLTQKQIEDRIQLRVNQMLNEMSYYMEHPPVAQETNQVEYGGEVKTK